MKSINWLAIRRREELEREYGISMEFGEEGENIVFFAKLTGTVYATEPKANFKEGK
jgi:hypothetical protein